MLNTYKILDLVYNMIYMMDPIEAYMMTHIGTYLLGSRDIENCLKQSYVALASFYAWNHAS